MPHLCFAFAAIRAALRLAKLEAYRDFCFATLGPRLALPSINLGPYPHPRFVTLEAHPLLRFTMLELCRAIG